MRWVRAAQLSDIGPKNVLGVLVEGVRYVLCRVDGEVYAGDDACTHQHARLSKGVFEDCAIECPVHYARFDMRSGVRLYGPVNRDLKVYPVKIESGEIFIALPALATSGPLTQ